MSLRNYFKPISGAGSTNSPADDKSDEDEIDENSDSEPSETESQPKSKKLKKSKQPIRKYSAEYLAHGFHFVDSEGVHMPLCLVCTNTFANSAMKPSHLKRHLQKKHSHLADKPIEYFTNLKREWKSQSDQVVGYTRSDLAAVQASFEVAYEIAKAKKPYSIGETLIQPCITKVVELMFGSSELAKINQVAFSRRTIARRFDDMARDVENQLSEQLQKCGKIALQFDESTDIAGEAVLIGFVLKFKRIFSVIARCLRKLQQIKYSVPLKTRRENTKLIGKM